MKIKDIPSGKVFYAIGPREEDKIDVHSTFMLDGGYTLQLGRYVLVKNYTKNKYTYWDAEISINLIEEDPWLEEPLTAEELSSIKKALKGPTVEF